MASTNTNLRLGLLGLVLSVAVTGCTLANENHCWLADGDKTCIAIFGGGFCASAEPDCEGHGVPYGCVFERPTTDACYSPTGNSASCAGANPAPECTEVLEESGESGMSETSDASEGFACGDGQVDGDEECDDSNDNDTDACTNACTLPACGDGVLSRVVDEACDDHNTVGGDLCTADCQLAGTVIWEFHYNLEEPGDDVGHEVELDPAGNIDILVRHGTEYRVLQLEETGALSWNEPAGPSGWDAPQTNLAVGPDGQVVVGGVWGDQGHVRQFDSNGDTAWSDQTPNINSGVLAVDVDAFGAVVVAGYYDQTNASLFVRLSDGTTHWDNHEEEGQFSPIALGADGQIRVWQNTRQLNLFDSAGMLLQSSVIVTGASSAQGMDLDGEGNAFVLTQEGTASYTLHKFDALATRLWSELQVDFAVEEGANGVAARPNGGALVAGYVEVSGQPRGKLTWFLPDGQELLSIIIEQDADDLTAQLYDVAVSPDGYAVAVGSRKVGLDPTQLWVRKFAI